MQPLCSLCLCGCFYEHSLTTEAQRTQRLHREEVEQEIPDFRGKATQPELGGEEQLRCIRGFGNQCTAGVDLEDRIQAGYFEYSRQLFIHIY